MHRTGLVELEAVLAVARRKGFRPAAAELGMSTSALSSAVAGLEARLGVRLFHRTTRSVSLTEAGEQFVARIAPALGDIQGAMEAVNSLRQTPAGTLRINAALGAARAVFAPIVLAYLRRYPAMTVDIVTEGRMIDIVAEGYDAGIRLSEHVPRDMVRVPLGGDLRMAIVASPDYFATHPPPRVPADLAAHECIRARLPSGAPSRWELAHHGETLHLDVPGRLILDAPLLMLDAARAGMGVALLAEWYVAKDLAAGRLVRVLAEWTPPFPGLALYYPAGRHLPAGLRAFIEVIREVNGRREGRRKGEGSSKGEGSGKTAPRRRA
ncbi:LysR family transcriptional regulator [Chondromyces apiculatus]|uniref:Transcriptional regulator, LysR family n=1 Tax=Chondromyces apiculatus DSM 436 TaxID=1192034 RepID=A0A017T809_9BACT|nr:LysR family transcriptional regulator [Chondromyces apiculatus]EYF05077.1 Transcriptional regulator, LysR family [Chondromyces apiculatus DSM 436]